MTNQLPEQDLDPTPLVKALIEKTKAGKLKWEATANANLFIASVGGDTTLKVDLETVEEEWPDGSERTDVPILCLLDQKGKTLWKIRPYEVQGGLWTLYKLAQRIGNKLDERMAALIEDLQKL